MDMGLYPHSNQGPISKGTMYPHVATTKEYNEVLGCYHKELNKGGSTIVRVSPHSVSSPTFLLTSLILSSTPPIKH